MESLASAGGCTSESNNFHSWVLRVENQDFEIILLEKNGP